MMPVSHAPQSISAALPLRRPAHATSTTLDRVASRGVRRQLAATAAICLLSCVCPDLHAADPIEAWAGDEAKLVFAEDFTDPASLQRFVFAAPNHWKRAQLGERWVLEHDHAGSDYQPPHRSPLNIALIADQQFGSFVLEYDVQQIGREYGHRDACVFFNFVDPKHFYYTHIATKADPHAHQIFTVDDAPRTKITEQGTDGFDWGPVDQWHHVRLVRNLDSGSILVYVNDLERPIMVAHDKSHAWGYLGFGSFDDAGRVTKIRVYAAETRSEHVPFFKAK